MDKVTMSVQEMAMQMGISLSKAYALTREADFPIVRVGKRVLVPVSMFKTKHKFNQLDSLIDVSSDTPEYNWFLASNP